MSEPQPPLKYDPDVIDPIVVKEYRSVWGLVIPPVLIGIGVAVAFRHIRSNDPYRPGVWLGQIPWTGGIQAMEVAGFCLLVAPLVALSLRRYYLGLGIFLAYLGGILWTTLQPNTAWTEREIQDLPQASARYQAEIAQYKTAVKTSKRFGDQFSETVDKRTLTYWRWAQMGIDDAVGVMYDPTDKFPEGEDDAMAFRDQTHGSVFRTKKMERGWTLVWHS